MTQPHDHDHGDPHAAIEDAGGPPSEFELLERALRELLIEKGVFKAKDIRRTIDEMDTKSPADGARVVAHAWFDAAYKARLLDDAKAAVEELGFDLGPAPGLVVLENTPARHHVVVCTLCSCYPRILLGLPPDWYKSRAYRSRVVADPRGVLESEFGTKIPAGQEVQVVDSTADLRYLILPERPAGTGGMSEDELAALVTRDCMIGVTRADPPASH